METALTLLSIGFVLKNALSFLLSKTRGCIYKQRTKKNKNRYPCNKNICSAKPTYVVFNNNKRKIKKPKKDDITILKMVLITILSFLAFDFSFPLRQYNFS